MIKRKSSKLCTVDACNRPKYCKDMCIQHYQQERYHATKNQKKRVIKKTLPRQFIPLEERERTKKLKPSEFSIVSGNKDEIIHLLMESNRALKDSLNFIMQLKIEHEQSYMPPSMFENAHDDREATRIEPPPREALTEVPREFRVSESQANNSKERKIGRWLSQKEIGEIQLEFLRGTRQSELARKHKVSATKIYKLVGKIREKEKAMIV